MWKKNALHALVAVACVSVTGCFFGTPVAHRRLQIEQDQDMSDAVDAFQFDTSALPKDVCTIHEDRDRYGPVTTITLDQGVPVKVLLVPTTQPAR